MNIENEFQRAEVYLEMAKEKFQASNYSTCLTALTKVYPHIRSLIEKVYVLDRTASLAPDPPGDNHP